MSDPGLRSSAADPATTTVGFIGTGVMGRSMAGHLLDAGYRLNVHNRTRTKADPLIARGAAWCKSPGETAAGSDAVLTIVGYPADVESVYLGAGGIIERARPGALLIDLTTSRPDLAVRIDAAARARGLRALDAPVSGGDIGAREARLSIMIGGDPGAFDAARPLLERLGMNLVHQGGPGSGQHCKMCNQIAIAAGMIGVCEALAYARAAGLDPATVLRSIEGGAAGSWSLSRLAPRMLAGDYAPGFYVKHFIKDMGIALESAAALGLELPGLALARRLYDELARAGGADQGTQALWRVYDPTTIRCASSPSASS